MGQSNSVRKLKLRLTIEMAGSEMTVEIDWANDRDDLGRRFKHVNPTSMKKNLITYFKN